MPHADSERLHGSLYCRLATEMMLFGSLILAVTIVNLVNINSSFCSALFIDGVKLAVFCLFQLLYKHSYAI